MQQDLITIAAVARMTALGGKRPLELRHRAAVGALKSDCRDARNTSLAAALRLLQRFPAREPFLFRFGDAIDAASQCQQPFAFAHYDRASTPFDEAPGFQVF